MENKVSDEVLEKVVSGKYKFSGISIYKRKDNEYIPCEGTQYSDGKDTVTLTSFDLASELLSTRAELAALQDKVRWVPVGEGDIPEHEIFEVCNMKSGRLIDACTFGSQAWVRMNPTHYRKIVFPSSPIPAEGENG